MSLQESFPSIHASLLNWLQLIHVVKLLDVILLLGVALVVFQGIKVLLWMTDDLCAIVMLPYACSKPLIYTVGYYALSTMIVGMVLLRQLSGWQETTAIGVALFTIYAVVLWAAYDQEVPNYRQKRKRSMMSIVVQITLVAVWTGMCAAGILGHAKQLFPLVPFVHRSIALLDSFSWLALILRLFGVLLLCQAFFRGIFATFGTIEYMGDRSKD